MTLLRDLIDIPASVGDADLVVRASGDADLRQYVVTDDLARNFDEALSTIGHAVTSGRATLAARIADPEGAAAVLREPARFVSS